MELVIPLCVLLAPLVKKETVKGIIGNTHGVNKANKPPKKPKMKIEKLLLLFTSSCWCFSQPEIFSFNFIDSFR